jgi:hypothetical protein
MPEIQMPGTLQACAWNWVELPATHFEMKPDNPLQVTVRDVNLEIERYGFAILWTEGEGGLYWSEPPGWMLLNRGKWPPIVKGTFQECCAEVIRWLQKGLGV